jgi:hypothetical protein
MVLRFKKMITKKSHHAATRGSFDGLAARKEREFTLWGHDLRIRDFFVGSLEQLRKMPFIGTVISSVAQVL